MDGVFLGSLILSLIIWIVLLGFWGQFWRGDQRLEVSQQKREALGQPNICAVIPARDEAALIATTLRSLLTQDYSGTLSVVLVDDQSTDNTGNIAQATAQSLGKSSQFHLLTTQPLPTGWSGKLWAMDTGITYAQQLTPTPDYFLLTDADIEHDPHNLSQLVQKGETEHLAMVSLMVLLRCQGIWEQLLIPAFVFFFEKLYPFRWVNDPQKATAAAAGGCILIRASVLQEIGGLQRVREALIDDCALAQAVKGSPKSDVSRKIWLGLTSATRSLRPYPSLESIWDMVARTAFTQLNYSWLLLLGTLVGMTLVYLVSPVGVLIGLLTGNLALLTLGLLVWGLMAIAYYPTLRLYSCSPLLGLSLPWIAFLYSVMTFDSALRHWQGKGGAWKGRVYGNNR